MKQILKVDSRRKRKKAKELTKIKIKSRLCLKDAICQHGMCQVYYCLINGSPINNESPTWAIISLI